MNSDTLTKALLKDPLLGWVVVQQVKNVFYSPKWKPLADRRADARQIATTTANRTLQEVVENIRPKLIGPWTRVLLDRSSDTYWTRTSASGTVLAEVYEGFPTTWVLFVKKWPTGQEPDPPPSWKRPLKPLRPRVTGELPDLAEAMCFIDSLFLDKGRVLVPGVDDG